MEQPDFTLYVEKFYTASYMNNFAFQSIEDAEEAINNRIKQNPEFWRKRTFQICEVIQVKQLKKELSFKG